MKITVHFFGAFAMKSSKNMPVGIAVLIRPPCINSRTDERIFMKFDIGDFYQNLSVYYNFCYKRKVVTGTLYEDLYAFLRPSEA
jgi:hypothetical protein